MIHYLHPSADVDISAGNSIGAKELVTAETVGSTSDLDRVLAAVSGSLVKNDLSALITVGSVGRPSNLIPTALEILGDLAEGERKHRKCSKSDVAKHDENSI
jgi:hypothetical protein